MSKLTLSPADAALERVRVICMGFAAAEEKLSHGAPSFHVKGKLFLMFVDRHHDDGMLAVWCKATLDEQRQLVEQHPGRFFVPPYVGVGGWVGVRLDRPDTDWIGLAILVENGWLAVAPARVRRGDWVPKTPPPPPVRGQTDAAVAREALARIAPLCLALPEATEERASQQATYRVRKKVFAYFLDNHHGDGIVSVCVKMEKPAGAALLKSDPGRFYVPAYLGARGWVGVRLDQAATDWDDLAARLAQSWAAAAPKTLAAQHVGAPAKKAAAARTGARPAAPGRPAAKKKTR